MDWRHLLAYITGTVDQELLLRNEYLETKSHVSRVRPQGVLSMMHSLCKLS